MSTLTAPVLISARTDLMSIWDHERNDGLEPSRLGAGSHLKAWWVCAAHGSYERRIGLQAKGVTCPFCLPHSAKSSMAEAYPRLIPEWDMKRNHPRRPEDVGSMSSMQAYWLCSEHGSYRRSIVTRTTLGTGCPECPATLTPEVSLAGTHPETAATWAAELNGDLTPEDVRSVSARKVWWECVNGHEPYNSSVAARVRRSGGCPLCASREPKATLGSRFPEIAGEWARILNGKLTPEDVTPFSDEECWWLCPEGHYPYKAKVSHRTYNKSGCPECGRLRSARNRSLPLPGESLADRFPIAAEAWDSARNGTTPDLVSPFSTVVAFWSCRSCSKSFEQAIASAVSGIQGSCRSCSTASRADKRAAPKPGQSLAEVCPGAALDWDTERNGSLTPSDVAPASKRPVYWCCISCGTRTHQPPAQRVGCGKRRKDKPLSGQPYAGAGKCSRCNKSPGTEEA